MRATLRFFSLTTATIVMVGVSKAQDLNSGYFIQDYKYRHSMNAAFSNDQNYFSLPILGNLNVKLQGNFGVGDVLFKNPGNGKYEYTFMHPDVPVDEAMSGFSKGSNHISSDLRLTLLSTGFKAFGGYNTIEVLERTSVNMALPYEILEFAKDMHNKSYEFNNLGINAISFAEIALGHSHQVTDDLRIGTKLKFLLGMGRADVSINGMTAVFEGNEWTINSGDAKAEVNINGIEFVDKKDSYESGARAGQEYEYVDLDGTEIDKFKIGGWGFGIDIGAEYSIPSVEGLKVSAAVNDLGFINWKNNWLLKQKSGTFTFDGFHDIKVRKESPNGTDIDDQVDGYKDQISDFVRFNNEGDQGSCSSSLAATVNLGAEYKLPSTNLSFGLLGQHHFNGDYSWTEGRLSANWSPLKWLNGGVNVAASSFCVSAGWIINIHPKGMNLFLGMDHILGKMTKEFIPLSSNANIALGMNIAW